LVTREFKNIFTQTATQEKATSVASLLNHLSFGIFPSFFFFNFKQACRQVIICHHGSRSRRILRNPTRTPACQSPTPDWTVKIIIALRFPVDFEFARFHSLSLICFIFANATFVFRTIAGILNSIASSRRSEVNGTTPMDEKPLDASCNDKVHPLYGHGVCKWPGCEVICEDYQAFLKWVFFVFFCFFFVFLVFSVFFLEYFHASQSCLIERLDLWHVRWLHFLDILRTFLFFISCISKRVNKCTR